MTQTIASTQRPVMTADTKAVSDNQLPQYADDGFLILRRFFTLAQIVTAKSEADGLLRRVELMDTNNLRCRWQDHVGTGECLFETFDPVADLSPACAAIATDPGLLNVVSALYGEQACLFKDKLIFKPPGAKGYALHQDYIAWPNFPRTFLTVLVPLDPATEMNGCTEVFTGYHKQGAMSPEDGNYHPLPPELVHPDRAVKLQLDVGDIAIFGGFTPHCSAPNHSNEYRRQLYLSYNAFSDGGHRREQHYTEFHAWLRKKYAEYGRNDVYFR